MFFISSAYAQGTAAAPAASDTSSMIMQFLPFVLIFVVFYMLLLRPQQKRAREHRTKLDSIRRGDRVLLGGGIMGKVTKAGTDELEVEIAEGVRVTATLAQAFRAPNLSELARNATFNGGTELANPDLDPETSWTAELALDYRDDVWSGALAAYYTQIDDLIGRRLVDQGVVGTLGDETYLRDNTGELDIYGVELTIDDFLARRQFPDQIAVYNRPTDVHPSDTSRQEYERFLKDFHGKDNLGRGECVGIPYSILVPRGYTNLWVAGRCHSSDTKVHGSIRAQSAAYMMGQAAGTAAAQSLASGEPANDLDTARLVETLRGRGAYLPQRETSRAMTRR